MPRTIFKRLKSVEELLIDYDELTNGQKFTLPEIMNRTFMAKVWHAFTALPRNEQGFLHLSKAKVLAQNIASVLKVAADVVSDFDMYFANGYDDGLKFNDFKAFINNNVITRMLPANDDSEVCFENEEADQEPEEPVKQKGKKGASSKEPDSNPGTASQKTPVPWDLIDQVCWTIYSRQALSPRYYEQFNDETLFSLWLWFNMYSDTDKAGVVSCPVTMDSEELNYWLNYLFENLLALEFKPLEFTQVIHLNFSEALDAIISCKDQWGIEKEELQFVIEEFRMEMIDGVIKKGFLFKGKRNLMKSQWKRRYCVLTLKTFSYYSDESMSDKKGQIPLSQIMSADPYRDRQSKLTRYQLETNSALFILEAEDLRSRNQWIRDIRFAIRCNMKMVANVHIIKAEQRKEERSERRWKERLEEEEKQKTRRRIQEAEQVNENLSKEIENVKSELEREEQQRIAEERAREQITLDLEARLESVKAKMNEAMERTEREKEQQQQELENEKNRVLELQSMRMELEAALLEEKQLRKEEETVMKMQAELVEEQIKARERLEEIKSEQDTLLDMEIQKRSNIQVELDSQKEVIAQSEYVLKQYEQKLKDSDKQKDDLYRKMKDLEEKLKKSSIVTMGSHRGLGAFPTYFFQKSS